MWIFFCSEHAFISRTKQNYTIYIYMLLLIIYYHPNLRAVLYVISWASHTFMTCSIVGFCFVLRCFFVVFLLQDHHLKYFNNVLHHSDTMTVMSDTLAFFVEPFYVELYVGEAWWYLCSVKHIRYTTLEDTRQLEISYTDIYKSHTRNIFLNVPGRTVELPAKLICSNQA